MTVVKRLGKPGGAELPDRLADVEDWLSPYWPGLGAAAHKVRAWHELRATVFAHVAETDPDHHYEALALVGIEQRACATPRRAGWHRDGCRS